MKNSLRKWLMAVVIATSAFAMSSCYYDPYYSAAGASYSGGGSSYGYGYGYGGSNFSTSFFVSTGDARWGYDPYCYSYYDYHRHCYYDPYLHGYYPVGYRPPVVVGCPHPYGYRSGYCPPPHGIRNVTVVNYNNRISEYRRSNYGWARQVRDNPGSYNRPVDRHPSKVYPQSRPNTNARNPRNSGYSSPQQPRTSGWANNGYNRGGRVDSSQGTRTRTQQTRGYNTPANGGGGRQASRTEQSRGARQGANPGSNRKQENRGNNRNSQPNKNGKDREEESRGTYQGRKSVRYLGQG